VDRHSPIDVMDPTIFEFVYIGAWRFLKTRQTSDIYERQKEREGGTYMLYV